MKIELRALQLDEPKSVYEMFQTMPLEENGFENKAFGKTEAEFSEWLKKSVDGSKGIGLTEGRVPATQYVLFVDDVPVGTGKLRHYLNANLEKHGGHIGYGVAPKYRGKGYANIILAEVLKIARAMGIDKALLTVDDANPPSWKTIEKNGGILQKTEIDEKGGRLSRFYWITL